MKDPIVAFAVRDAENVFECIRSALGLAVNDMRVAVYILGCAAGLPAEREELVERMEMLDDLEARLVTDRPDNAELFEYLELLDTERAVREAASCDLVAPF
jgi:hypothetical protein